MTITDTPVIPFTSNGEDSAEQEAGNSLLKHLPPQGMSRASQLLPFVPFSKTTLFEWSKDGRFPAPIKLSPTMTAWRNSEVIAWLEGQSANVEGA
ncbi:AlpA family phage regulatory protein [Psychrobacter sp. ANT_H56B]|uniref:helix-turn-helix transcriptional regulator n=1 Tax=Psychrobacter sp. ANT_H56B TaxID=2597353 RepID=UPI0011F1DF3D|nr:AlpA family phage regulatory protein [Psychrobacter sp. ANT_H56B]KAA0929513.1 AlpA family phage regulatory protein [Psychrobacter sp. ANT_H56B]